MISENVAKTDLAGVSSSHRNPKLWTLAQSLESTFISEMLSQTGIENSSTFGGGIGEDQFASFLTKTRADSLSQSGGIGLAQAIYESLAIRGD